MPEDNEKYICEEDLEVVAKIQYKETCCESYKTPKGRCYTCPENRPKDPDEEESMSEDDFDNDEELDSE